MMKLNVSLDLEALLSYHLEKKRNQKWTILNTLVIDPFSSCQGYYVHSLTTMLTKGG